MSCSFPSTTRHNCLIIFAQDVIKSKLGEGAFATVYKVHPSNNKGEFYAMKICKSEEKWAIESSQREADLLERLSKAIIERGLYVQFFSTSWKGIHLCRHLLLAKQGLL